MHVIEGRKLECKTQPIVPVANVFVGDENRGSRVLRDTDKPFWDEVKMTVVCVWQCHCFV